MITKKYVTEIVEIAYDVDGNGDIITATAEEIQRGNYTVIHLFADEGKVIRRKADGEILTNHISLGTLDSADNYEEVEAVAAGGND